MIWATPRQQTGKNPIGSGWIVKKPFTQKNMRLAIVGSPSFEDYARFTKRVEEVLAERGIMMSEVQVISCGADALAARYSREVLGKEPHIFTADWKQFGRSAGPKRDD
jgi:hypothetical protein